MATNTYKALAIANAIQAELAIRLGAAGTNITGGVASVAIDTDGNPWIQVGTSGTGNKGGVIKVKPTAWTNAKDILGNTAFQYVPHTIQLSTETGGSANTDVNDPATLGHLLMVLFNKGCSVDWYKTANGTAPATNSSPGVTGTFKVSVFNSIDYPLVSAQ